MSIVFIDNDYENLTRNTNTTMARHVQVIAKFRKSLQDFMTQRYELLGTFAPQYNAHIDRYIFPLQIRCQSFTQLSLLELDQLSASAYYTDYGLHDITSMSDYLEMLYILPQKQIVSFAANVLCTTGILISDIREFVVLVLRAFGLADSSITVEKYAPSLFDRPIDDSYKCFIAYGNTTNVHQNTTVIGMYFLTSNEAQFISIHGNCSLMHNDPNLHQINPGIDNQESRLRIAVYYFLHHMLQIPIEVNQSIITKAYFMSYYVMHQHFCSGLNARYGQTTHSNKVFLYLLSHYLRLHLSTQQHWNEITWSQYPRRLVEQDACIDLVWNYFENDSTPIPEKITMPNQAACNIKDTDMSDLIRAVRQMKKCTIVHIFWSSTYVSILCQEDVYEITPSCVIPLKDTYLFGVYCLYKIMQALRIVHNSSDAAHIELICHGHDRYHPAFLWISNEIQSNNIIMKYTDDNLKQTIFFRGSCNAPKYRKWLSDYYELDMSDFNHPFLCSDWSSVRFEPWLKPPPEGAQYLNLVDFNVSQREYKQKDVKQQALKQKIQHLSEVISQTIHSQEIQECIHKFDKSLDTLSNLQMFVNLYSRLGHKALYRLHLYHKQHFNEFARIQFTPEVMKLDHDHSDNGTYPVTRRFFSPNLSEIDLAKVLWKAIGCYKYNTMQVDLDTYISLNMHDNIQRDRLIVYSQTMCPMVYVSLVWQNSEANLFKVLETIESHHQNPGVYAICPVIRNVYCPQTGHIFLWGKIVGKQIVPDGTLQIHQAL